MLMLLQLVYLHLGKVDLIKNNIRDNGIPALLIFKDNEKIQSFESKQWKELLQ